MSTLPDRIYATAYDGSTWSIPVREIIADMEDYEAEDDMWPRPFTLKDVLQWVGDNSESIDGWRLEEVAKPEPGWFGDFRTSLEAAE